jgi:hypothetical protein
MKNRPSSHQSWDSRPSNKGYISGCLVYKCNFNIISGFQFVLVSSVLAKSLGFFYIQQITNITGLILFMTMYSNRSHFLTFQAQFWRRKFQYTAVHVGASSRVAYSSKKPDEHQWVRPKTKQLLLKVITHGIHFTKCALPCSRAHFKLQLQLRITILKESRRKLGLSNNIFEINYKCSIYSFDRCVGYSTGWFLYK